MSRFTLSILVCLMTLGHAQSGLAQSPFANLSAADKLQLIDEARASDVKQVLKQQDNLLKREQAALAGKTSADARSRMEIIVQSRSNIASATDIINGKPVREKEKIVTGFETITRSMRPTFGICSGAPLVNERAKDPDAWKKSIDKVSSPIAAVARSVGATVFVVGKSHVITNRHVIQEYAYVDGAGKWHMKDDKMVLRVSFPWEYTKCLSRSTPRIVRIVAIEAVGNLDDKNADFAILRTEDNALPPPPALAEKYDLGERDRVAVIGYPTPPVQCGSDASSKLCTSLSSAQIRLVFALPDQSVPFSVERFAPGFIKPEPLLDTTQFAYDSSTWEGNSGSPVIRMSDGKVIGLHFGGDSASTEGMSMIGIANRAIKVDRLREVLAEAGVAQ